MYASHLTFTEREIEMVDMREFSLAMVSAVMVNV